MNEKTAKKIRKMYRRSVERQANELAQQIGNAMKPKPKYIPWKVWMWALGFFIKIKR